MKAIKYLVMGALTLGFSTSVMAQDGSKADVDAVKKIISSKPGDLDKQMKPYYKANKKNAENLVAFARAFFEARDTANAREYANFALQASKNKCAPAYILLGDMEALYDNGGAAAAQYEQAIYADPKLVEAYYKYALVYRKIDPRGAAAKLDELKIARPDISIDALKGHIFMLADDRKSAYNEFKKVPVNQINPDYLNEFARASYFGGHFDDAVIACEEGLKHKPNNPAFTRLAMFSNYELKKYDDAKAYIHKYFNETDSAKFSEYDHFYTALIYQALDDKENMYAQYDKALELVNDSSMIKRHAILKSVADSYLKDQAFDNAIKYYQDYLACKPELNSDDQEGLARIYSKYADADESRKAELISKAIEAYKAMGEKFPIQKIYAAYQCATMNNKLDKTGEKGLAKPDYQKVVELLEGKADRDNSENTMLKYSYHYLMSNAFLYGKNKPLAKEYANKILAIDPEYAPAQQIRDLK